MHLLPHPLLLCRLTSKDLLRHHRWLCLSLLLLVLLLLVLLLPLKLSQQRCLCFFLPALLLFLSTLGLSQRFGKLLPEGLIIIIFFFIIMIIMCQPRGPHAFHFSPGGS